MAKSFDIKQASVFDLQALVGAGILSIETRQELDRKFPALTENSSREGGATDDW
jgi:hypothetical protein